MKVECIKVGRLGCNCYILDINGKLLVVDPGDDYLEIRKRIGKREVIGILVTHHHFDHVGALDDILQDFDVLVYDYNNLKEKEYRCGEFVFKVIYTKGHSEDSITFYFEKEKIMFVGDFIFANTIGRCDLVGSDVYKMRNSLAIIKNYDDDIILYPGHGSKTTLGDEKLNNPYFKEGNLW